MIDAEKIENLKPNLRGIEDLGEIGSCQHFKVATTWKPKGDEIGYIVNSSLVSTNLKDPSVIVKNDACNHSFTVEGEYGLASFDQISYAVKDIETNEMMVVKGWPPTDLSNKRIFKVNRDPRENLEIEFVVDYVIQFEDSSYRRDRVKYIQTVRNFTYVKLTTELSRILNPQSCNHIRTCSCHQH